MIRATLFFTKKVALIRCLITERDRREWKLKEVDPCDRDVWNFSVRSAMREASQLPGREPTDVDDAPASAH